MKKIQDWKEEKESKEFMDSVRTRMYDSMKNSIVRDRWDYKRADGYQNQLIWNQTLLQKIKEVNKKFGGSLIITSPEIACILEDNPSFTHIENDVNYEVKENNTFYTMGSIEGFLVIIDCYLAARVLLIIKDDFFTTANPECAVIMIDNLPTFSS